MHLAGQPLPHMDRAILARQCDMSSLDMALTWVSYRSLGITLAATSSAFAFRGRCVDSIRRHAWLAFSALSATSLCAVC